jgi:hypothetical protein
VDSPAQIGLPFFAYGIFQPGQLGYYRLRELVQESRRDCSMKGSLRIRDGLPLIDPDGADDVAGVILVFKPEEVSEAYKRIGDIEPDKHYRWDQRAAQGIPVNVLVGRSPKKGSVEAEKEWDGRNDPLFTSALEVIEETLEDSRFDWDLKPLFRLQMAYLLLWSSIERYVSLRYHLGDRVTEKVNALADEMVFVSALREKVQRERTLFRADRPGQKVVLDPNRPRKSLEYYYQIRSNITHRGKAVVRDHQILEASLSELLYIFRCVLKAAFSEA